MISLPVLLSSEIAEKNAHSLFAHPVNFSGCRLPRGQGNRKVPKTDRLKASPSSATGGIVKAEGFGDDQSCR